MTDRLFGQSESIFALQVDETAKHHLLETARWTKFLAILFMAMMTLLVVFGVIMALFIGTAGSAFGAAGAGLGAGMFGFIYIVLFALYIYPLIALYRFSKLVKSAVLTGNQHEFNEALRHQKSMYKYMGILMIIVLALYGIAIVFGLIAVAIAGAAS